MKPKDLQRVERSSLEDLTASLQTAINHVWGDIEDNTLTHENLPNLETLLFGVQAIIHKLKSGEEPETEIRQVKIWKVLGHYLYQHGDSLWSVRDDLESSLVLTTEGEFEYEPGPSHRTEDWKVFVQKFRFDSKGEAVTALKKYLNPDQTVPDILTALGTMQTQD